MAEAKSWPVVPTAGAFLSEKKPTSDRGQFDKRRTQYTGPHTVIDGVRYDWCDKGYKSAASPNGMYMPEVHIHEEWFQK